MNFFVDDDNIEVSFETIAKELLLGHVIRVNKIELEITEIEFYYFKKDVHEDNYTHPHKLAAGSWRLHKSGIDITFAGNEYQDGGILIRGVKKDNDFINGPLKALNFILSQMGDVTSVNCLQLVKTDLPSTEIIKTHRFLPNKTEYPLFKLRAYRFIKYFDKVLLAPADRASILTSSNST